MHEKTEAAAKMLEQLKQVQQTEQPKPEEKAGKAAKEGIDKVVEDTINWTYRDWETDRKSVV